MCAYLNGSSAAGVWVSFGLLVLGAVVSQQTGDQPGRCGLSCSLFSSSNATKNRMRTTWRNQLGNQVVNPLQVFRPSAVVHPGELIGVCSNSSSPAAAEPSLVGILQLANQHGLRVKAVGSGHSYSPVATTTDLLIDTHSLDALAGNVTYIFGQQHASWLRASAPPLVTVPEPAPWDPSSFDPSRRALVEVEGGIVLLDLVQQLQQSGLALTNMGGYNGQTLVGAISTSTHGSGIKLGPFSDMVRSLVLITDGSWNGTTFSKQGTGHSPTSGNLSDSSINVYRIEPSDGITDPAKWVTRTPLSPDDASIQLIQDDTAFCAATCSMGAFGIISSVTIEVMQMYYLTETRSLTTLDQVVSNLWLNDSTLQSSRHLEVLIHPYPTVNMSSLSLIDIDPTNMPAYYKYYPCLVTARDFAAPAAIQKHLAQKQKKKAPAKKKPRDPIAALFARSPVLSWVLGPIMRCFPRVAPWLIDTALQALVDSEYTESYYNIFDLGVNGDAGFAAEVGLSVQDAATGAFDPSTLIKAVEAILVNAQTVRKLGLQYQTSPFSVRFVQRSNALLSMMYQRDTAMIELDMLNPTYAGAEVMARFERSMAALGGRMHWGLSFDSLNGASMLRRLGVGDNVARWVEAYGQFNARGTFDNVFTEHMGFRERLLS